MSEAWRDFHAGECWRYRAPAGFEHSRLLIGAVFCFKHSEPLVACAVTHAPRLSPDGSLEAATIPFLPMTCTALAATVVALDGASDVPPAFATAFQEWRDDPRGLVAFTVAFDGRLDHLIARQMASLVAKPAG